MSGIRVRSCFAFSANHSDVEFIDRKGCSIANFVESFKFVEDKDYAEAELNAKFKFPESNKIHVQCDVFVCSGENECPEVCIRSDCVIEKYLYRKERRKTVSQIMLDIGLFI